MIRKITAAYVMFAMIFSLIGVISVGCDVDKPDIVELPDCSNWSQNDSMVYLGVSSWSLLGGLSTVSGNKVVGTNHCISLDCFSFIKR